MNNKLTKDDIRLVNTALARNSAISNLMLLAEIFADGHFTIMKFTTNYRVCLGTPSMKEDIDKMAEGATLYEAINNIRNIKPIG